MANALLLGEASRMGDAQGVGVFANSMAQGQNMAAQRQQMNQNALSQQWAGEDRQRQEQERQQQMQAQQQQAQMDAVREDYAKFMMLPDDNTRTQAWQSGLAQQYGQDPNADWRPTIMQLTQQPGFLPPEVANKIIQERFAPPKQQDPYTLSPGSQRRGPNNELLAEAPREFAPQTPNIPSGYRRTPTGLEPEPGGPADPANPLNAKRTDAANRYTPKEMSTARSKLQLIQVAQNQLDVLKKQREKLRGAVSAGFGMGWIPSEDGKNFDAAVDQIRSSVTGLKRVPGVGAMSDYETRLDQSMLPERGEYESSIDQKIDGIQEYLNQLNSGYGDIVGEEGLPMTKPAAAPSRGFKVVGRVK